MVSYTDLVSIANLTEKIKFQPSKKNSSTIPGSWMVPRSRGMILGQAGVVGGSLSGQEDSYDLFESCAALGSHLGRHTSRQEQSVEKWFWERKTFLKK